MDRAVDTLRRFNRSFTQRIGVLDDRFLGLDRPLGPSRILWEVGLREDGDDGRSIAQLRDHLDLDSGYLSRLLRTLEAEGLVTTDADPSDGRRRVVRLTPDGRREWEQLDRRSDELAGQLVSALTGRQRERLTEALDTADRLLRAATVRFDTVDPQSPEAIASMTAYFDELDRLFPEGFDPGDTLVADAPELRSPEGLFLLATSDGTTVACGGLRQLDPGIGEIKRMWVSDDWRGLGLGRRMLTELEDRSRAAGHHTVRLDTNSVLTEAITMYETAGYHSIERYNDNPFAKHWFEKSLI